MLELMQIFINILTYRFKRWNGKDLFLYYFETRASYKTLLQLIHRNVQPTLLTLLYLFILKHQRLAEVNGLLGAPNLK